jgi:HEAT repeat protein
MVGVHTGSVLIVTLAWRSAEIAAASSVLMLLVALAIRQYLRHEERVRTRIVKIWRPLLTRVAIEEEEEPPALPRLAARHRPFLMDEWNALQDAVRGGPVERLNALALRLGLDGEARQLMDSRHVGRQILAIRALGHLRDPGAWSVLEGRLAAPNALVSFYAAAALVQIDAERAMPGIMSQLAERESWPGEAMARLIVDAGTHVASEPIRAMMLSLPPTKVPPLLPWLARVDAILANEVAVELLRRHRDDAHLVAAALLVVLEPQELPGLLHFATSADADVRKNLAQTLGRLGGPAETGLLIQLMCDRVWWVRYHAGQSLLKLLGTDSLTLDALRAQLKDPYALDMLEHVRAEGATT